MKTSETGIALIKSFEGLKYRSYKLAGESYYTAGFGHTGADVKAGYTYSLDQINKWLVEDLVKFEKNVMQYNDIYKWSQNEFDALVSFAYNVGGIDMLVARGVRSRDEIRSVWLKYCHDSTGLELDGLKRRRKAELALFTTPYEKLESYIEVIPNEKN